VLAVPELEGRDRRSDADLLGLPLRDDIVDEAIGEPHLERGLELGPMPEACGFGREAGIIDELVHSEAPTGLHPARLVDKKTYPPIRAS
jgi:hypothetical protein